MDRDTELLISRAAGLAFGIFGHIDDPNGEKVFLVGGSGIFIAPFQALTARHVSRELLRTDPNRSDDLRRRTKGYFETPHTSGLFQAGKPPALSVVDRSWESPITDICYMQASADWGAAEQMQFTMTGFFDWSLEPPPVGSHVVMVGYPKATITISDGRYNFAHNYPVTAGSVIEVFRLKRDSGMYNFPCFCIDTVVDHGFSGGPVFWNGRLCGIVSGGSVSDVTYVASLWPICLMGYEYRDQADVPGRKLEFGDLFDRRVLRADDWTSVKHRISKKYDGGDRAYAYIDPED